MCLGPRQAQWSQKTCQRLPDCPHFHLVFTLPEELNTFFKENYRTMADVFFAAVAETINTFLSNNWNCEKSAYFAVLHTWGSNLSWHPHLHVLISAGGVSKRSGQWRSVPQSYAFPVKGAMSEVFGSIFLRRLEELERDRTIPWPKRLDSVEKRRAWRVALAGRHWNIFAKPTLGNTRQVVRYLARYTSRIAISNHRIKQVDVAKREVSIGYKDYRDGGKHKEMTLSGKEFIRRFSQHLCPKGFRRIRQYGLLCGKSGRFKEVEKAPKKCIAEDTLSTERAACPKCKKETSWEYGDQRIQLTIKGLRSFSLERARAWQLPARHMSNKKMDANPAPAPG